MNISNQYKTLLNVNTSSDHSNKKTKTKTKTKILCNVLCNGVRTAVD